MSPIITEQHHRKHLRYNITVNVLDGSFFGFALGFASYVTVIPLFLSQLTDSAILIGLIPALHSFGWQFPQLFTANWVSRLRRFKPAVLFFTIQERLPFGELIQVEGYLADAPYTESIQEFFRDAKASPFYEDTEQAEAWQQIEIERIGTQIVVTTLASISSDPRLNTVTIQGVVVRSWKGGADSFARLAIYDQHTEIIGHNEKKGLPRRKPHYVTVRIPGGEVDGKKIVIHKRNRLRASGHLHIHFYRQTLPQILERADKKELIEAIPSKADGIYAVRDSLYVIGVSVIVFAKRTSKQ